MKRSPKRTERAITAVAACAAAALLLPGAAGAQQDAGGAPPAAEQALTPEQKAKIEEMRARRRQQKEGQQQGGDQNTAPPAGGDAATDRPRRRRDNADGPGTPPAGGAPQPVQQQTPPQSPPPKAVQETTPPPAAKPPEAAKEVTPPPAKPQPVQRTSPPPPPKAPEPAKQAPPPQPRPPVEQQAAPPPAAAPQKPVERAAPPSPAGVPAQQAQPERQSPTNPYERRREWGEQRQPGVGPDRNVDGPFTRYNPRFDPRKRFGVRPPPPPATTADGRPMPTNLDALKRERRQFVNERTNSVVIKEPDNRTIIKKGDRTIIVHDEAKRFERAARDAKVQKQADGSNVTIIQRPNNVQIFNETDKSGQLVRRYRRDASGREFDIIDNRRKKHNRFGRNLAIGLGIGAGVVAGAAILNSIVDVPPPRVDVPRRKYIVDYDAASEDDVYEAFAAPPVDRLERRYTLDEVRATRYLRDRMRRVDLNDINFDTGRWDVEPSEYRKLRRVARAMLRVIDRNPNEVFLIEGYTDAVGSEEDNLTLSDRRAESVSIILSDQFGVPPENLTTQGYGEQYLKIETSGPERFNRRVAVRRITPLIASDDRYRGRDRSRYEDSRRYEDDGGRYDDRGDGRDGRYDERDPDYGEERRDYESGR